MALQPKMSCDGFPTDSSTSSRSSVNFPCLSRKGKNRKEFEPEQISNIISSSSTSSSGISALYQAESCVLLTDRKAPPNIGYEVAIAKSIMQQCSTLSGDNLFDHLSDLIKRVIDERPPNVIDFFEEFSRSVREQKLHLPERFPPDAVFDETRLYRIAKRQLMSMRLPYIEEGQFPSAEDQPSEESKSTNIDDLKLDIVSNERMFITFNERVQQLQFYWNQCGFSISSDDIFQLACAMDRLQTHPAILQCRFWGVINGLKSSYYVVEASLTREELNTRIEQMQQEIQARKMNPTPETAKKPPVPLPPHIGPELTPGAMGWENYPEEELAKMRTAAVTIPTVTVNENYDVPPEMIGNGLNRFSYFVVNALCDDWTELPIVTPKQVIISRMMKKFLTGDLEADIDSYPCFPGKEKHYLRAMIARITAGTYIAPSGYYRKMTKREQFLFDGNDDDEMEEEEEEEPTAGEEDEDIDNDIYLLRNEKYELQPLESMTSTMNWVHVRPAILQQGRIVWYDEEQARKDREKEMARLLRMAMAEEMGLEEEEEEEEDDDLGDEEGMLDALERREYGPMILSSCVNDLSSEYTIPWIPRFTSRFTNKNERVLVMHSNVWPGAFSFLFEKVCESIYMGWGHKYNSRNMPFTHLPPVVEEYPLEPDSFTETNDPSVAEEEAYRLSLLKKEKIPDDIDEQIDENDEFDDMSHISASEN